MVLIIRDYMSEQQEKTVASLVTVQLPAKLDYFVGDKELDLNGGKLCAIYDDGSFEVLPMDEMQGTFDSQREGESIAKLNFDDHELLFQIRIKEPRIQSFSVKQQPIKKEYLDGEHLDLSGLELEAHYENGRVTPWMDIPVIDHVVKIGEAVYPLKIEDITVPIYIKVSAAKIVGIRMGKLPDKLEYLERRDTLSVAGATIVQVYDSGREEEFPLQMTAVRGFSNLKPGPQEITVQIGRFTTSFQVVIREKTPVHLDVTAHPLKESYIAGQTVEIDGLRLSAEYDNGETRVVEQFEYEPKVASLDEPYIRIHYGPVSAEIPLVVMPRQLQSIEMCQLPYQTKYMERKDALCVTGGKVQLNYNFGEPNVIPLTNDMVHGFDNRSVGPCKLEVQYEGFLSSFSVEIIPAQLLGILIAQKPDRTEYAPGELFDKTGLQVSGFYSNGLMQRIQSYLITPQRPLVESDVAIVITSMDKSAIIPIRVSDVYKQQAPVSEPVPVNVQEPASKVVTSYEKVAQEEKQEGAQPKRLFANWFYPSSSKLRDLHDD